MAKLRNIIITCVAVIMMMWMAIGCDQDSDVGGNDINDIVNSIPAIGFNIHIAIPNYDTIKIAYPDVTGDWITNKCPKDIIDAVHVLFKKDIADLTTDAAVVSKDQIIFSDESTDGTGTIKIGIATTQLISEKGLVMDIKPLKYEAAYISDPETRDSHVYYIGNLKECIVITDNITGSFKQTYDVTIDGIYSDIGMNINVPN